MKGAQRTGTESCSKILREVISFEGKICQHGTAKWTLLSFLGVEKRRLMAQFDDSEVFEERRPLGPVNNILLLLPMNEQPPRHAHNSFSSVNV